MRSIKLPSWTERLFGVEPVAVPPHVFALDASHLRYGSFHRGDQGWVFETYRLLELPAESFAAGLLGGTVRDPRAFQSLVQGFVEREPAIEDASLVLPDAWLRLTFVELGELPSKAEVREDLLRFKLRRLVPFRIEDLRLSAVQVSPLPTHDEPVRLLLGFAIELLLAQIEDAFAAAGVRIGQITNTTLATLAAVEPRLAPDELTALVLVEPDDYTISFVRAGEPLLYRYKSLADVPAYDRAAVVRRDLRLTRNFVQEKIPDAPLARLYLVTSETAETEWQSWLYEELEVAPETMTIEHFGLARVQRELPLVETATLLGAASFEVR